MCQCDLYKCAVEWNCHDSISVIIIVHSSNFYPSLTHRQTSSYALIWECVWHWRQTVSTAARWRAAWCLRQSLLPGCVWEKERKYSCQSRAERQAKRYATQWVHQCHVSVTPWDHIDCLSAPIGVRVRESVIHVWENDSEGGNCGLERSITGSGIQREIMREKDETSAMMQLWFNLKSCINYANTFKSHVKYW